MRRAIFLHFRRKNVVFGREIVSIMYRRVTGKAEMCIMMVSWKDKTVLGGINQ